ncbi:MAG TPA: V-type ATP synthase subunit K [Candidatus Thermoplasmatota archaeon]|nr:V-type ATP synthase subunit K [Candidatus Thermoplasmatota archaeon]
MATATHQAGHGEAGVSVGSGLVALGAGLAVGLTGLATAIAEKDIGSAAVGAMAEDRTLFTNGLILMVIPETIVLFGFVIAFLMLGSITAGV